MSDAPAEVVPAFGVGDASYLAAGGEDGIRRLVDDFYDAMDSEPIAAGIRAMHPASLDISRDKLARFLCGWMNGPNRYREKYGAISIPGAHAHLSIGPGERDAWLYCMEQAIAKQGYSDAFKTYLYAQLSVPANRVVNRET